MGDTVLKSVSAAIEQTVRNCDVVSRYGGEEFAIVLPETALKGAVILAERLRKKVELLVIKVNDENIQITVSLGLTIWEPGLGVANKAEIIDAADRALYQSKKTGRNKVSFITAAKPH